MTPIPRLGHSIWCDTDRQVGHDDILLGVVELGRRLLEVPTSF